MIGKRGGTSPRFSFHTDLDQVADRRPIPFLLFLPASQKCTEIRQSPFSLFLNFQLKRSSPAATRAPRPTAFRAPPSSTSRPERPSSTLVCLATNCWASRFSAVSLGTHPSGVGCHLSAKVRNCRRKRHSCVLSGGVKVTPSWWREGWFTPPEVSLFSSSADPEVNEERRLAGEFRKDDA